jgi:hypothetical protein
MGRERGARATRRHRLIVNATSLGMNPSDPAPIPARLLAPHHIVFDCVYRPSKTALAFVQQMKPARAARMACQCCCIKAHCHFRSGSIAKHRLKRCAQRSRCNSLVAGHSQQRRHCLRRDKSSIQHGKFEAIAAKFRLEMSCCFNRFGFGFCGDSATVMASDKILPSIFLAI